MSSNSEKNKRIAINTLLLYVRMLFTMAVSLYTSRVVLNILGVEDFGIYNVVGGVVALLGFLTGSLSSASSRFITFGIGKNDLAHLKKVFGSIITIHCIFAILILFLAETVGLWFMNTQLQIPENRMHAAFWTYQFSVFSAVMSVISVPYNASIIAHEKMNVFAYISIMDVVLKLLIVYLLMILPFEKLITYSFLYFCIQLLDQIIYVWYCSRHFEECSVRFVRDKVLFKEIFVFAGWTLNGSLAYIGYTQGLNVLLNIFFGPSVNAARGIAVQVQGIVQRFCSNFQMALNPQITKSYALGNYSYMHQLLITSSKFSFFLLLFLSLPIVLETHNILQWWLGVVPDHTVNFIRLILLSSMLSAVSNPLIVSVHATGKLKKFQLIEGSMLLAIVPVSYILLKYFGFPPESVFVTHLCIEMCTQCARIKIVLPMIQMDIMSYWKEVVNPLVKVIPMSLIVPLFLYHVLANSIISFIIICATSVCSVILSVYFLGCTNSERYFLREKVRNVVIRILK